MDPNPTLQLTHWSDGFFEVDLLKECIAWTSDTSFDVQTRQGKSTVSQGPDGRWFITKKTP